MLFDEQIGGSVDVEIDDHGQHSSSLTSRPMEANGVSRTIDGGDFRQNAPDCWMFRNIPPNVAHNS